MPCGRGAHFERIFASSASTTSTSWSRSSSTSRYRLRVRFAADWHVPGAPGMQSRVIYSAAHLSRFHDRRGPLLEARGVCIRGAAWRHFPLFTRQARRASSSSFCRRARHGTLRIASRCASYGNGPIARERSPINLGNLPSLCITCAGVAML